MAHHSLGDHRKLNRLSRRLGICKPQAVGHLEYLWWKVYECKPVLPDGMLHDWEPGDIEDAGEWDGEAGAFVAALVKAGFVEQHGDIHAIHDYGVWAPNYVQQRWRDCGWVRQKNGAWLPPPDDLAESGRIWQNLAHPTRPDPTDSNATRPDPEHARQCNTKMSGSASVCAQNSGVGSDRGNDTRKFQQVFALRILEAFDIRSDTGGRQVETMFRNALRIVKYPERERILDDLVERARSKVAAGLRRPIAAWQKEFGKQYPDTGVT
jgi:hypothetical protein